MIWDDYYHRYLDFTLALSHTNMIALSANTILSDFPKNLPPHIGKRFTGLARQVSDGLLQAINQAEQFSSPPGMSDHGALDDDAPKTTVSFSTTGSEDLFFMNFLNATMSAARSNNLANAAKFVDSIFPQQLAMVFAHIDAFLGDSLRYICRAQPNILKRNNKIEWKVVLESGSWDRVVEHMIDRYVYDFGWSSIEDSVKKLRSETGLEIAIDASDLALLCEAEQIRHMVMHNGGKATTEYIKRIGNKEIGPGQSIVITYEYVSRVTKAAEFLAFLVFQDISLVHFQGSKDSLPIRFERRTPPDPPAL